VSEDLRAMGPDGRPSSVTGDAYDPRTIIFHWLTAALVLLQWIGAHYIDAFPRGPLRVDARATHICIGAALIGLLVLRLGWRSTRGRRLAPIAWAPARYFAKATHALLYALLAAVLAAGVANAWIRGDDLFGIVKIPSLAPGDKALRHLGEEAHELLANTLMIVAGLHALAGVGHELILRDRTLRRMFPARPGR
jgi:cytochrome b561